MNEKLATWYFLNVLSKLDLTFEEKKEIVQKLQEDVKNGFLFLIKQGS